MLNTCPNAPGGEAARTSISRDGEIMPDGNPGAAHRHDHEYRPEIDAADQQNQHACRAESSGRDIAMPLRRVGYKPAGQHADRVREQERGQAPRWQPTNWTPHTET